jgi:beta-galactosidase
VEEMVLQYRNHPSIIIWGVRINESPDNHDFYVRTNEVAHRLDPTRQTGGVRNFSKSELLEDVYTYNDFFHDGNKAGCEPKSDITSNMDKPYLITENNGHMFPTKSFDNEDHRLEHALRHARVINDVASHSDICGSFAWCMADYNTHRDFGSGDRICYHGVTDMFRNHKMAAAVYKAQGDYETVLEISSSMDIGEHPASINGKIWIFTNADSVKMYKNDIFVKEYKPHNKHFPSMVKSPILIDDYVGKLLETEEKMPPELFAQALELLKKTGVFDVVSGVLVGKPMDETYIEEYKNLLIKIIDIPELPIVYNLNVGHATPHCIIPFGIDATVDAERQIIRFAY